MRFYFQLDGLLRVRRLLEDRARERLDQSMLKIRNLEHRAVETSAWLRATAEASTAAETTSAAELRFIAAILKQSGKAMEECVRKKDAELQNAEVLRAAYLRARREREMIARLRENALRKFNLEESRREQSALDEASLVKLIISRNLRQADEKDAPSAE